MGYPAFYAPGMVNPQGIYPPQFVLPQYTSPPPAWGTYAQTPGWNGWQPAYYTPNFQPPTVWPLRVHQAPPTAVPPERSAPLLSPPSVPPKRFPSPTNRPGIKELPTESLTPFPPVLEPVTEEEKAKSKTLLFVAGGALVLGAAGAAALLMNRAEKVKTPEIPPLYTAEDFKIPEGIDTPEGRRARTLAFVNEVFPKMLEVKEKYPKGKERDFYYNRVFNEILNKHFFPQGPRVFLEFWDATFKGNGSYSDNFEVGRYGELIEKSILLGSCKYLLPKEEDQQPVFHLGQISCDLQPECETPGEHARFYSVLLHETLHAVLSLARDPRKIGLIKELKSIKEENMFREIGVACASEHYIGKTINEHEGVQFPEDSLEFQYQPLQTHTWTEEIPPEILSQFIKEINQPDFQFLKRYPQYKEAIDHQLQKFSSKEEVIQSIHLKLLDELECNAIMNERLNPENKMNPTHKPQRKMTIKDLDSLLRIKGLQELITYLINHPKIQLPMDERIQSLLDFQTNLPIESSD